MRNYSLRIKLHQFFRCKIDGIFNAEAKVSSPEVIVFLYANDLNQQLESEADQ